VVLRLVGFLSRDSAVESNVLLKCSRDRAQLQTELDRSPESKEPASHVYVLPDSKEIYESGGWFATAWRFRQDAIPLSAWLSTGAASEPVLADKERVAALLEQLFVEGLNYDYRRGSMNRSISPAVSLYPNVQGRFRIIESSRHLVTLIRTITANPSFEIDVIESFLVDEALSGRPLTKVELGSYECLCHGDLHSRNLLVTSGQQPVLIDPWGRIPHRHWASDIARLSSDLWTTAWDQGPNSYLWDKMLSWAGSVQCWIDGRSFEVEKPHLKTYSALRWLRDNVARIFEGCFSGTIPTWEFELAMAVEFLNASRYESISAPKRCMSLLVAKDILSKLEAKIPFIGTP